MIKKHEEERTGYEIQKIRRTKLKQERNEVLSHNYGACKNAKKRNTISFAVAMCVYVNVGFCLFSTNCDGFLFEIVKMKRAHFVVRRLKFARIPEIEAVYVSVYMWWSKSYHTFAHTHKHTTTTATMQKI